MPLKGVVPVIKTNFYNSHKPLCCFLQQPKSHCCYLFITGAMIWFIKCSWRWINRWMRGFAVWSSDLNPSHVMLSWVCVINSVTCCVEFGLNLLADKDSPIMNLASVILQQSLSSFSQFMENLEWTLDV